MGEALGQVREVFDIVKNKPYLSGLLEVGKATQEIIQSIVPASTSRRHVPKESTIKLEVATSLYRAIGEEFPTERQMKRYLNKIKKVKEMKPIFQKIQKE